MSERRKRRRTDGKVKVMVGERNPRLFLVPKKAAESVVELLRPYVLTEGGSVAAHEALADYYARYGKAGTVLRGFRSRERMTQQQLAEKVRVTQGDVSAMENGRRPIGRSIAIRLAKVFKTDHRVFM